MIRRTYTITSWRAWADELNDCAIDFHRRFGIFPNILLANEVTYRRIDMVADKDHVLGDGSEVPGEAEYTPLSSFVGAEYEPEFAVDPNLGDGVVSLIYDTDPDGGGEPVPDEDTEEVSAMSRSVAGG